jgi:DNA replication and repair protein RecF
VFLSNLEIRNYKNWQQVHLLLSPQINCFVGVNGAGKTNLLDAVYYLSLTRSHFSAQDQNCLRHGGDFFTVAGTFVKDPITEDARITVQPGSRKSVKVNNNEHKKLSDHIGLFPLVMITPNDIMLIHEGSTGRRKFLDGMISQTDKTYLSNLLAYNRALEQRNRQLRLFAENNYSDSGLLDAYDRQLVTYGSSIYQARVAYLGEYVPVFSEAYRFISGTDDEAGLSYSSQLHGTLLEELLSRGQKADLQAQRTLSGIHRDDLDLTIGGRSLSKFGSQGQQKSYIIALKLAQYAYLSKKTGLKPLLLLDDIFEKLDAGRLGRLMERIRGEGFGQIFISDTHLERVQQVLELLPETNVKYFRIVQGEISVI